MQVHTNFIEKLYLRDGVRRGRAMVFEPDVALKILDSCEKHGVRVLGVDGFFLEPGKTIPSQENSVDLSTAEPDTISAARKFIKARVNTGLQFEMVLDADVELVDWADEVLDGGSEMKQ